jgi:hypothetical protein
MTSLPFFNPSGELIAVANYITNAPNGVALVSNPRNRPRIGW